MTIVGYAVWPSDDERTRIIVTRQRNGQCFQYCREILRLSELDSYKCFPVGNASLLIRSRSSSPDPEKVRQKVGTCCPKRHVPRGTRHIIIYTLPHQTANVQNLLKEEKPCCTLHCEMVGGIEDSFTMRDCVCLVPLLGKRDATTLGREKR